MRLIKVRCKENVRLFAVRLELYLKATKGGDKISSAFPICIAEATQKVGGLTTRYSFSFFWISLLVT
jgi:hypothetical protein